MRKQIAAANWKMNLTYQQAEKLIDEILEDGMNLSEHHQVLFAVPFPYLIMCKSRADTEKGFDIAAQNCYHKENGAFTGEVSAEMLHSIGARYCIVGHSERREYFNETNEVLAQKINTCLKHDIVPIFCCGEKLEIREKGEQNTYVQKQLEESLFHLNSEQVENIIIAYEPVWAIGTGKTATTQQAQEMHAHLRAVISDKFGKKSADKVSILYGGSVKADNAAELFGSADVDGGLVGGASLVAQDFIKIIKALKS